jgi:ATP-dependent Zn protease
VPRGQALGVTYQRPDSDRYNYPEAYLRGRIVGALGGRAAEEIVYGTKNEVRAGLGGLAGRQAPARGRV